MPEDVSSRETSEGGMGESKESATARRLSAGCDRLSAAHMEVRRIFTGSALILSGEAISTRYAGPSTRGGRRW